MQDVQEPLYGLSTYASESPEWTGTLPLGPSADNYTIFIAGSLRSFREKPAQRVALMVVSKRKPDNRQIWPGDMLAAIAASVDAVCRDICEIEYMHT